MNCIIVDDNELAIESLAELLKLFCPQVSILGQSQSIKNAVGLINELKPVIVFLDVEMNNESGFDLFTYFTQPDFLVIFTTSHEKYAVKAFKTDCFDYLLKPIDSIELVNTINKVEREKSNLLKSQRTYIDEELSQEETPKPKKVALISGKGYSFIDEEEIVYFKAEGQYTKILTCKKESYTSSKNLGEIEETLSDNFFRCHKSWIINLKYVSSFIKEQSNAVLLDDVVVEISSRKRDDFIKLFNRI
ncbi:LytTR family DNA-binding domain-containing protein [Flavobacterium filum]|uniref:LytR/AlgR family response regulator transcription factor n=1 Tax=Flavobacterium filum TaxID=370974 RepID=UPI0023F018F9|nr:LytTR family DNA-binding domain-containing protein [Flavobacterium filum]